MMIDAIGWIAGAMFAFCGAPQAWKCLREGHSDGLSYGFLGLWTGGEIFTIIYVVAKHGIDGPLLFNYSMNLVFLVVMWRYKLYARRSLGVVDGNALLPLPAVRGEEQP